jgi:hypothetical protein
MVIDTSYDSVVVRPVGAGFGCEFGVIEGGLLPLEAGADGLPEEAVEDPVAEDACVEEPPADDPLEAV